jgi:rhomboid protease GluP
VAPPDQDGQDTRGAATSSALADRWLAALLAAAEHRRLSALVETVKPPVTVVNLPDLKSGVLVLDRGDADAATLTQRLNHLTSVPTGAVLHLVLVGGGPADRPLLLDADRNARNPNRLGVWHLDGGGVLTHVAGRKLALLREAEMRLPTADPLTAAAAEAAAERGRLAQEEAVAFATRLQGRRPFATWILLGAIALFFLLASLWARASSLGEVQVLMGANHRALVATGQVWRLLSHAFLHADKVHLLVNGISLFSMGGLIERLLGWRRFIVLYVASALAGGLASAFLADPHLSVGASGAIWGLLGASLALVGPRQRVLPVLMSQMLRRQLVPMTVINVGISFLPRIDLFAHFGGGLMGFALVATGVLTRGLPSAQAQPTDTPDPWPLRIGAGLAIALMATSVALALITGRPWVPQNLYPADPG